MNQEIIDLYDEFTHTAMGRRSFMEKLVAMTGSVVAAETALSALQPNYALAAVVSETDARLGISSGSDAAISSMYFCVRTRGTRSGSGK